jgi:uncharacterized protein (DUF983 family)
MSIRSTDHSQKSSLSRFWQASWFGLQQRCPRCGRGHLFNKYLKVNATCSQCGLALSVYPSDDAPPYFTIMVVGHLIVPAILLLEELADPPGWLHLLLWLPLTALLTLILLPRIKGMVIAWHWAGAVEG